LKVLASSFERHRAKSMASQGDAPLARSGEDVATGAAPGSLQARNARSWGTGEDEPASCDEGLDGTALLLARLRQRAPTEADIERLGQAADTYHANKGDIAFDRCLGLRGAATSWRISERNLAIARAVAVLPVRGKWLPYARLETEWAGFVTAGPWRLWRDDPQPPAAATDLQRALYWASRHNRGESLSAKHIQRICGQLSGSKCQ
jgi:hypothetical protein